MALNQIRWSGVLFVLYFVEGSIGVQPTILALAQELACAGHQVEIRTVETGAPLPGILPPNCKVLYLAPHRNQRLLRWLIRFVPGLDSVWFTLKSFQRESQMLQRPRGLHRIEIGIEPRGGVIAWFHSCVSRSGLVQISLELNAPDSYRGITRLIPWLTRKALKNSDVFIIQDRQRLASFSNYYGPLPRQTFLLPNSTSAGHPAGNDLADSQFLHKRLQIDRKRFPFIALHAGMVEDVVYAPEICRAFGQLDLGFALVLHERIRRSPAEPYMRGLQRENSKNLFLSLDPVPFDQLNDVFASAKIGLVFYRPVNENYAQVTFASGTLAFYLKHGIPVIMNSLPGSQEFIGQHQVGVLVTDPGNAHEFAAAIEEIMGRYQFYSANALRCFREQLDFSAKFKPIRAFLESL